MALAYPFQQNIIEKVFGVSTYTTAWYLGLYLPATDPGVDPLATFDSGITRMALPTMELDATEFALDYPAVSNAAAFDYTIDADADVAGWYIINGAAPTTRADLAFYNSFGTTYTLVNGDTLHWFINSLVVEFWY
jgi:hypothetical protein